MKTNVIKSLVLVGMMSLSTVMYGSNSSRHEVTNNGRNDKTENQMTVPQNNGQQMQNNNRNQNNGRTVQTEPRQNNNNGRGYNLEQRTVQHQPQPQHVVVQQNPTTVGVTTGVVIGTVLGTLISSLMN